MGAHEVKIVEQESRGAPSAETNGMDRSGWKVINMTIEFNM